MTIRHLYPAVEPSLNLDFANSKKLDSRITFTRGSTATYSDESGIIRTAAANEARFDHDSDGNSLGLLIEESRTNEFPYSEDFSNSSWTKVNTTVTTNAATAPDGTSTANRLQIGATNGVIYDNAVQGVASNSTISMWVKAVNPGTDDVFRLASAGDLTADLTATNEWVRYTFTSSTNTSSLHGIARPSDNTAADVYVWGAQFEEGKTFPTSYIPTAGATATRAVDVASITGSNFSSWYNNNQGTYFLNAVTLNGSTATNTTQDNLIDDGYMNIQDYVGASVRRRAIATNPSGDFNFNPSQAPSRRVAVAFDSSSANAAYNGILQSVDTTVSGLPNTASSLRIGATITGLAPVEQGYITRLTYWPTRLPDATLQALTL